MHTKYLPSLSNLSIYSWTLETQFTYIQINSASFLKVKEKEHPISYYIKHQSQALQEVYCWSSASQLQNSCSVLVLVSVFVLVMDIGSWCNSGSRGIDQLGRRYMKKNDYEEEDLMTMDLPVTGSSSTPRWRVLWRRIKKEKKKIFVSSDPVQNSYDPYTYSQNFDHGSAWAEPDNLSRSFSARYADPSRIFQRNV